MSTLTGNPAVFEMTTGETPFVWFDTTVVNSSGGQPGGTPTAPTQTLTALSNNQVITNAFIGGGPTLSGSVIQSQVNGVNLRAGQSYRLTWGWTLNGQVLNADITINVLY